LKVFSKTDRWRA